jgi:hypothetical protein
MANTQHENLGAQEAISETTIHGWPSIFLGLLVGTVGILIILVGIDIIVAPDESFHVPRIVVAIFGLVFALVGFPLIANGIFGQKRKSNKKKSLELNSDQPWLADYQWNPSHAPNLGIARLRRHLWGIVFISLFLAPFNWFVFLAAHGPGISFALIVGLFDVILVLGIGYLIYRWAKRNKYGTSTLAFTHFPFFLGQPLAATLAIQRSATQLGPITLTLRCIEEHYETRQRDGSQAIVSTQIWADSKIHDSPGPTSHDHLQIPVAFDLPADLIYTTQLGERPARYWELSAKADAPGIDYDARFLIPIYPQP